MNADGHVGSPPTRLRAGDYVQVRSAKEIDVTLDARGCLEGLPFMPEMARHCGSVHRVYKRIDKVIDIIEYTGLRRMSGVVTLEDLRCDGSSHGSCQSGCQILWKEAWLRRCEAGSQASVVPPESAAAGLVSRLQAEAEVVKQEVYRCQATDLFNASSPLHRADPRQYLEPLWSGNVTLVEFLRVISLDLFNAVQRLRGGSGYPHWEGSQLDKTPTVSLGLRPGDWVKVRLKDEIVKTLDKHNRNRGLWFDREMLRYCGGRFRVLTRVDRIINEKSGKLVQMKTPSVILEGVTGRGEFYRFNPQNDYILWREIWLERADQRTAAEVA